MFHSAKDIVQFDLHVVEGKEGEASDAAPLKVIKSQGNLRASELPDGQGKVGDLEI